MQDARYEADVLYDAYAQDWRAHRDRRRAAEDELWTLANGPTTEATDAAGQAAWEGYEGFSAGLNTMERLLHALPPSAALFLAREKKRPRPPT